ncbi:hypothetical protein A0J61_07907 [Choanephora cucurbitarum]|uniref:Uncharacterized protein n=1 Tax=Choanephora cucurbitarum TaxID=101091 RepID=A0A1C7N4L9_9FUNG|nr:hypothetical protein A0J61_07907 [Choanephora cucurbitarum]
MGFPITAFFLAASYFTSLLPLSKELMVTFPNKASEIKRGKLLRITWSTNATEGVVSVSLMSKSIHTANQKVLSLGQLNVHLEELEWIVPFDIPPGTQCKVDF